MDKMTPATLKRNSGEKVRKPLPAIGIEGGNESVIQISNIKVTKKNVSDIIKIIGNVLCEDVQYIAEIIIKEQA